MKDIEIKKKKIKKNYQEKLEEKKNLLNQSEQKIQDFQLFYDEEKKKFEKEINQIKEILKEEKEKYEKNINEIQNKNKEKQVKKLFKKI